MSSDQIIGELTQTCFRMLKHGQEFWEKNQNSPHSDEMSAALTDMYMTLKRHNLIAEYNENITR